MRIGLFFINRLIFKTGTILAIFNYYKQQNSNEDKMMRRNVAVVVMLVMIAFGSSAGMAKNPGLNSQTKCPVMGGETHSSLYTDHENKRVYFCCGMCKTDFVKDPEKYMKILEAKGEKPFELWDEDELYDA